MFKILSLDVCLVACMGFPRPVLYTLDKGSELSDREKHGVWLAYAMEMFTSRHEGDAMHSPGSHGQRRLIRAGVSTGLGWGHIFASVVAGNQTPFSEFIRIPVA
jgi:hypothetical protein